MAVLGVIGPPYPGINLSSRRQWE